MRPEGARYTKSHEYAILEGDIATIGITDFAIEHLSDLVFIDLPDVGSEVTAGERFGEVESVKAVAELNSPLSGEVVEKNEALIDDLAPLSNDPFGEGWMIKIRVSDPSQFDELLTSGDYEKALEEEEQ